MAANHNIIVIPGLGDEQSSGYAKRIVHRWEKADTEVIWFDSRWYANETFKAKFKRLLSTYDHAAKQDGNVSVVSYSAGGALMVSLLAERKLSGRAVVIAGKMKNAGGIGPHYQQQNPALKDAVEQSEQKLNSLKTPAEKITCLRPFFDNLVPVGDMLIPGARVKTVPMILHSLSIGFALFFMATGELRKT